MRKRTINFADLFAGIGGFHCAFRNISKDFNFNIKPVYVSEIDKYCKEVYEENYRYDRKKIFDMNDFKNHNDNKLDIVFCGFPCQPFSSAGLKKGFNDKERG